MLDGRLEALDARTGQLCADFANHGTIDLNRMDNGGKGVVSVTSATVVFEDLVIVASAIGDNERTNMPSGFVRAFDARTGQERWLFRAIDVWNGGVVWQRVLPDPGAATPMSFQAADRRQFVVIAAGGSILLKSPLGDALVAFALSPK